MLLSLAFKSHFRSVFSPLTFLVRSFQVIKKVKAEGRENTKSKGLTKEGVEEPVTVADTSSNNVSLSLCPDRPITTRHTEYETPCLPCRRRRKPLAHQAFPPLFPELHGMPEGPPRCAVQIGLRPSPSGCRRCRTNLLNFLRLFVLARAAVRSSNPRPAPTPQNIFPGIRERVQESLPGHPDAF